MTDVALATTSATDDPDLPALTSALEGMGLASRAVAWDDPSFDWAAVALAVIRSTWDYVERVDEFLAWSRSVPHLCNPAEIVAWNADKRYLADLGAAGVRVVPTTYVRRGDELADPGGAYVVKPAVGAGSRGAARFDAGDLEGGRAHLDALLASGRVALVQPYVATIEDGETDVVVLDGAVSHAVRKRAPMGVRLGDAPQGPLEVAPTEPTHAELDAVAAVLGALPIDEPLCYARVDLVEGDGGPAVLEVELIEPFLFLDHGDGAAQRLAEAIARRVDGRRRR